MAEPNALREMRKLYRRRGKLVMREFFGKPLEPEEKRELRAIDKRLNAFEMAEAKPGLDRMRHIADEMEKVVQSAPLMQRLAQAESRLAAVRKLAEEWANSVPTFAMLPVRACGRELLAKLDADPTATKGRGDGD